MKMSSHDQFDCELSVMKTRQNNDVTKCTSVIYVEIDIKLSWLIELSAIYVEN